MEECVENCEQEVILATGTENIGNNGREKDCSGSYVHDPENQERNDKERNESVENTYLGSVRTYVRRYSQE